MSAPGSPSSSAPFPAMEGDSEFVENVEMVEDVGHFEDTDHIESADHVETVEDVDTEHHASSSRPPLARRSTLMLKEDEIPDFGNEMEGPLSRVGSGEHLDIDHTTVTTPSDGLVETRIEWRQGGKSVYVTGSFTGWRQMIPLRPDDEYGVFGVVLKLLPGTHRLRFVVDGELRCSDYMLTATDSMGNLVNYMEVQYPGAPRDFSIDEFAAARDAGAEGSQLEYTQEIPEIFVEPEALERLTAASALEFTTPPQLPPHLDGVILNTNWNEKDNNSVLPIPNHVVLNHLATTSIKHNVLAVASVSRYQTKYVTQILYTPIEGV